MAFDLNCLIAQIRRNCDVSDAQHCGIFSICGLALRLRDLYKWEHGLEPWEEGEPAAVLDWIGQREANWETLAGEKLLPLSLDGRGVDPFDTEAVNDRLAPLRLYYGAGYARGLKPTFFIAAIENESRMESCRVYRLGRELARDLLTLPALSQGRNILLRRDAARRALYDQIVYMAPSGQKALAAALDSCGITDRRPPQLQRQWGELLRVQEMIHLHHELGETLADEAERVLWHEIIAAFALTRVELLSRRVKDMLADTHPRGTLGYICRRRSAAGLALYLAFMDRVSRNLFSELASAMERFLLSGCWQEVEQALESDRAAARRFAAVITSAYGRGRARRDLSAVEAEIDQSLGRYLDGAEPSAAAPG